EYEKNDNHNNPKTYIYVIIMTNEDEYGEKWPTPQKIR
ncbi:MAG: hypothetical protein D084_Lepto4C00391G0001, partial [Leptospirillum sp. Group IV 'UBA BS']